MIRKFLLVFMFTGCVGGNYTFGTCEHTIENPKGGHLTYNVCRQRITGAETPTGEVYSEWEIYEVMVRDRFILADEFWRWTECVDSSASYDISGWICDYIYPE